MIARRLAYGLLGLGVVVICGALVWWAVFYGDTTGEMAVGLGDAVGCIFSSGGTCGLITGAAQAAGETAYDPAVFWAGMALLVVAALVAFSAFFGALLLLAAIACLVRELVAFVGDGTWSFIPLGAVWAWIHTPSLGLLEAAVVRHLSEDLWYDWVFPILEAPAWLVLGAPGLVLLLVYLAFGRRRHRRVFQRS